MLPKSSKPVSRSAYAHFLPNLVTTTAGHMRDATAESVVLTAPDPDARCDRINPDVIMLI
jgi:hypothetical protein